MSGIPDLAIVGGGVIGLSIAYELARRGASSVVLDRDEPGRAASWAGAGIVSPGGEAPPANPMIALRHRSALLFPEWSIALLEETGIDNGYRRCGGVDVAFSEAEEDALRAAAGRWRAEEIAFERLAPTEFGRVEPALNPALRVGYFVPDRAQIRNPRHVKALAVALGLRGVPVLAGRAVEGFDVRDGRVTAVRTAAGPIACGGLVIAAGPWSGALLEGLGLKVATPPIRGQIVLLRGDRAILRRIVEHGSHYLVPRDDGRVLMGATEEDVGFDPRTTAEAVSDLIGRAIRLCPALATAEVERAWAGLRPGSLDSRPYIGAAPGYANVFVATGHRRAGLQLSPATAEVVADLVTGRLPSIDPGPFRPGRPPSPPADSAFRS